MLVTAIAYLVGFVLLIGVLLVLIPFLIFFGALWLISRFG